MNSNGALDLVLHTRDLLRSLPVPALAPFLAEWPDHAGAPPTAADLLPAESLDSSRLPVLRWLPDIAGDACRFGVSLVADLCRNAQSLLWRQTYTASETGEDFLRNYGWTEILGPQAPVINRRVACGFLLLGPSTLYPPHRHAAEEVYVPLSGTAHWLQGDAIWRERLPGSVIHHGSEEPHAMRTGARPLLALYLWRSNDLSRKARLDPSFT